MKRKKLFATLALTVALVCGITIGASAAGTLQQISAYLNSGITIKYDGEAQILTDAAGVRVYPISYNGSTYLPIRAVSDMLGIAVDWDQATQTVLLGDPEDGVDLIDTYKAYSLEGDYTKQVQSSDGKTENIGGVDVGHYLYLGYYGKTKEAHFNLGGKYTSLTFQVYAEEDVTLTVYGDNGSVLAEIQVTGNAVPKTVTVPLLNTTELFFYFADNRDLYIFDAKLT